MSTALVVYDEKQLNIIKSTVANGTTPQEFDLFIQVCLASGLNPFARQIYAVMRDEWTPTGTQHRMTIQTGIDGYRLLAQRSGKYRGQTKVEWCDTGGVWVDVWLDEKTPPAAARVGVYHADYAEPIYAVATYKSYAARKKDGTPMAMWAKMPDVMLAKCAESLALRKAFPAEMSGIYTAEEMTQADSAFVPTPVPTITVTPVIVDSESAPSPVVQPLKVVKPTQELDPAEVSLHVGDVFGFKATDFETRWTAYKQHVLGTISADADLTQSDLIRLRAFAADEDKRAKAHKTTTKQQAS